MSWQTCFKIHWNVFSRLDGLVQILLHTARLSSLQVSICYYSILDFIIIFLSPKWKQCVQQLPDNAVELHSLMKAQQAQALHDFLLLLSFWVGCWYPFLRESGERGDKDLAFGFVVLAGAVTVLQVTDEHLLHSICLEIDHTIPLDNPFKNWAVIVIGETLNSV